MAAILAADVVGYSRLMAADEESTLEALKLRRSSFEALVTAYGGREFGSAGDSLMAQFPSPVNAVRCAQAIQTCTAGATGTRRMQLRIGVNLGDVIEDNGLLFGDAVNVAARLQSLARPGGVLISAAVYEQVRKKLEARFIDGGAHKLRNIAEPVRTCEVWPLDRRDVGGRVLAFAALTTSSGLRRAVGHVATVAVAAILGAIWGGMSMSWTSCRSPSHYTDVLTDLASDVESLLAKFLV